MHNVHHDKTHMRYEVTTGSDVAFMAYRPVGDNTLEFYSTQVPPAFRGQGVAAALVKRALDDAKASGKKVIPSCSYVDAYMKRHDEYGSLKTS